MHISRVTIPLDARFQQDIDSATPDQMQGLVAAIYQRSKLEKRLTDQGWNLEQRPLGRIEKTPGNRYWLIFTDSAASGKPKRLECAIKFLAEDEAAKRICLAVRTSGLLRHPERTAEERALIHSSLAVVGDRTRAINHLGYEICRGRSGPHGNHFTMWNPHVGFLRSHNKLPLCAIPEIALNAFQDAKGEAEYDALVDADVAEELRKGEVRERHLSIPWITKLSQKAIEKNPDEMISISHGGGFQHIHEFITKREGSGYYNDNYNYDREKGIYVSPNWNARDGEYAVRHSPFYFDRPAVFHAKIAAKYLKAADNLYEAILTHEHLDKLEDVSITQPSRRVFWAAHHVFSDKDTSSCYSKFIWSRILQGIQHRDSGGSQDSLMFEIESSS